MYDRNPESYRVTTKVIAKKLVGWTDGWAM